MKSIRIAVAALASLLAFPINAHAEPSQASRTRAREIYEHIIGMNTAVSGGQTPAMAAYLAGLFRAGGFPESDIHILPLGNTASLVVRYRGDGAGGKPILFIGHMDVVEARRSDWQRDPFTLVEENGYFYGRGTLDMKEGDALLTATFLDLRAEGFRPTRDLILYFSGDEETSGATTIAALRDHRDLLDAEFALNADSGGGSLDETTGRPTSYALQTAEKTFASFTLTAHNPGGHSSQPRPDNAIYDVVDALARVRAYQFPVMWNDTTIAYMRAAGPVTGGAVGAAMTRFAAHPGDARAAATLSADPFHVGQVRTTCIPTLLQAGHADNALPQSAVATINCRIFPGVSIASVQAKLQDLAGARIAVAPLDQYHSSDASPLRPDVLAAVTEAVHATYPGVPITPSMSAGASDGVFFREVGIPTYGVADTFLKDSDDFSHGLNERLPVASFYNGLTHWRVMINALAGPR
ncbi:MAG TPA: M20/M25/M40 family metallo-hydrolase [Caulobacterales bacterium]|nr:M20/M25/M40 family metallo-hydrolase [Caulobacterales bacterium]